MSEPKEGAIEEKKGKAIEEKKVVRIYRVRPNYFTNFNSSTGEFVCEIHLPGVPKENVELKVLPELFDLKARRDNSLYTLTEYFPYVVDVQSFDATYENGLLTMKGKLKDPLADAVEITIQ